MTGTPKVECPVCRGKGTVVCRKCGGTGHVSLTEAKCLWCSNTIEIENGDKVRMTGKRGQNFNSIYGWYHNGVGYDPDTRETKVEFFLCPDHRDGESVRKAFAWARDTLEVMEGLGE